MQTFRNILFVSHAIGDEMEALTQAFSLARNNKAALRILIVCPELPATMSAYREKYNQFLHEQINQSIAAARASLRMDSAALHPAIEVQGGGMAADHIIRHVLRDAHDLVMKEAEPKEGGKGFKAVDMELLRKCPCPVWLSHPIEHSRGDINVAVAVDPESEGPADHDLALRLLRLSRSLADTCSGELQVISCWDYEFEEYLRGTVWVKVLDDELLKIVMERQAEHRAMLDALIGESGVGGRLQIHHARGRPDKLIPTVIDDKEVDILVMGTVARTGIPGFLMGNTAENIVQKIGCSLLALKPAGFVSPVKAY